MFRNKLKLGFIMGLTLVTLGGIGVCAYYLRAYETAAKEENPIQPSGREVANKTPKKNTDELPVKLAKVPDLRLAPRPPITKDQARQIKDLIAGLAALDKPDFGLSSTLSGETFAPVPGLGHAGMFLLANHRLRPSESLKALVALGPDALPFLLDALDDQTPTKITVKHDDSFGGGMWHAAELRLNPVNPTEQATYKARKVKLQDKGEYVKSYTVKVGDICFVVIGQIVGRSYQAVRYQPTANIVLNSPTHDPKLCAAVRAIWKAKDPRRKLFDSLLADYATEGVYNGKSLDGWDYGSHLQCGAALRLLFHFEKESASLLAGRLGKLDIGKDKDLDSFERRCVANGVRAKYFIKAVAWSKNPLVREALSGVFKRGENVDEMLAALPAIADEDLIRSRLEPMVAVLPADEGGPYGEGFQLLVALGQRTPKTARAVFERYLRDASAQRCHTVCLVLRELRLAWDTEMLRPLLDDSRTWGWTYAVEPDKNEPRRLIRVCDEAAVTLSRNHPELKFTLAGEHADLNKQIAAIRTLLGQRKGGGKKVKANRPLAALY